MTRFAPRSLSEDQVCRLLASGGTLVFAGGEWRAYRTQDARRRPAGIVSPLISRRLLAEAIAVEAPGDAARLIANAARLKRINRPAGPLPSRFLSPAEPRKPVSLLAQMLERPTTALPDATRLKTAARWFAADVQPCAASAKLERLEGALGPAQLRLLEALLCQQLALQSLAICVGCPEGETEALCLAALRQLAAFYGLTSKQP
ncbi:hypothetical protein K1X12_00185 [Hyphomonas sp. WL0036]|uniref:hypothetical protein n=1 Tax=Hyphomonas sediminis TaxID=2866160 RepID=UPI001C8147C4|nr:hypothetical protein [Hyphomonas sediminis]MBY9065292.1 hypothetical protein [Hyphomonas sediminis]